jgi:hypothetical protein
MTESTIVIPVLSAQTCWVDLVSVIADFPSHVVVAMLLLMNGSRPTSKSDFGVLLQVALDQEIVSGGTRMTMSGVTSSIKGGGGMAYLGISPTVRFLDDDGAANRNGGG